jgi:hypothetical protein
MIKVGQKKKAKYWGDFTVKKVAELAHPVMCKCEEKGLVEFMPTIVQIEWEVPPSADNNEYWFPYWQKIQGKEKYGQFAPMIGADALLQLLRDAINQDFFNQQFLLTLEQIIAEKTRPLRTE